MLWIQPPKKKRNVFFTCTSGDCNFVVSPPPMVMQSKEAIKVFDDYSNLYKYGISDKTSMCREDPHCLTTSLCVCETWRERERERD